MDLRFYGGVTFGQLIQKVNKSVVRNRGWKRERRRVESRDGVRDALCWFRAQNFECLFYLSDVLYLLKGALPSTIWC